MQLMAEPFDLGIGMTSRRTRERLIGRLSEAGIHSQEVLQVMRHLPRHLFVDEALASRAYEDSALPIGHGQTISQPYTVALMTQALIARGRPDTVLEIGTGSGFQTAVLASLVRRVYSVERVRELLDRAQERLVALKMRNIRLRHGDGAQGWREYAPFQGIMVTAAPRGVPRMLAEQLAPGGVMVMPIGEESQQMLVRVVRGEDGFEQEILDSASFVPLLSGVS
ncbi:Protein-L-isoaspartate O-methyltransferase [Imhoffiella purpurea]|uniref:Protein-L-isoaspartate O-methyltransferase n=1 Tax=Imhoffiella purpurea TaxID=1249627 RepID=W9VL90_9GAMM|nr:protein-L-isoaspartate(D-aspartate) O-methyltransferase [Imhoffiella purpurea]EXJ16827.1 Protein-L-isoaspartate O-methyltransferase [Imhoffiella purpurea]